MSAVERIVAVLCGSPVSPEVARLKADQGGLPEGPGFYAWWIKPGMLAGVPRQPHPGADIGLDLMYVGISPNAPTSKQTLRSRVRSNHLGGNTGSSTFRYGLAALLMDAERFQPLMKRTEKATKYVLPREDNRRLRDWQHRNLSLTWCVEPEPWRGKLEKRVIAAMQPPMNLAENEDHPFHATMSAARKRFRAAARER